MFSLSLCIIFYTEAARGRSSDWKYDVSVLPFTIGFPGLLCTISAVIPQIEYADTSTTCHPKHSQAHTLTRKKKCSGRMVLGRE